MKIKLTISLLLLVLVVIFYEYYQNKYNINKTVETSENISFIIKKDFFSIRKSLVQGKFEEEILKINNATVLDKKWDNLKIYLEKPLSKNRYWELTGVMLAKIKINNEDVGSEDIEMKHNIEVGSTAVKIVAQLESPINKIGLTALEQEINLKPAGRDSTWANASIKIKVKRLIPSIMEKYAQEKIDKTAEGYLEKVKEILENLPEPMPGIFIPLKQ